MVIDTGRLVKYPCRSSSAATLECPELFEMILLMLPGWEKHRPQMRGKANAPAKSRKEGPRETRGQGIDHYQ